MTWKESFDCEMTLCDGHKKLMFDSRTLASCYCEEKLRVTILEKGFTDGMKAFRDDIESICNLPDAHDALLPLRLMILLGVLVPALSPLVGSLSLYMVRMEPYVDMLLILKRENDDITLLLSTHPFPRLTRHTHTHTIRYESRVIRERNAVTIASVTRFLHLTVCPALFSTLILGIDIKSALWYRQIAPSLHTILLGNALEPFLHGIWVFMFDQICRRIRRGHAGHQWWDGSSSQKELNEAYAPPEFSPSNRLSALAGTVLCGVSYSIVCPATLILCSLHVLARIIVDYVLIELSYARRGYNPLKSVESLGTLLPVTTLTRILVWSSLSWCIVVFIFVKLDSDIYVFLGVGTFGVAIALFRMFFSELSAELQWFCFGKRWCSSNKVDKDLKEDVQSEGLSRSYRHVLRDESHAKNFGRHAGLSDTEIKRQIKRHEVFPNRSDDPWRTS